MRVPVVWTTRMNLWGRGSLLAHNSNPFAFDTFVAHNSIYWHEIRKRDFNSDGGLPCIDVWNFQYPRPSPYRAVRTRSSRFLWEYFNRRHWTDHQRGRWCQYYSSLRCRTRWRERSQGPTLKSKLYGVIDRCKINPYFLFYCKFLLFSFWLFLCIRTERSIHWGWSVFFRLFVFS